MLLTNFGAVNAGPARCAAAAAAWLDPATTDATNAPTATDVAASRLGRIVPTLMTRSLFSPIERAGYAVGQPVTLSVTLQRREVGRELLEVVFPVVRLRRQP